MINLTMAQESYRFIVAQINTIDKSKYIESEKAGKDLFYDEYGKPTQKFYLWWINNHADNFRKAWPYSSCRNCSKIEKCKNCLKESCPEFEKEVKIFYDIRE
jgi:hypothetical protein